MADYALSTLAACLDATEPEGAGHVARCLRRNLTIGQDSSDPDEDVARTRALALFTQLAISTAKRLNERLPPPPSPSEEQRVEIKKFVQLADTLGSELYFGSGAYELRNHQQGDSDGVTHEAHARFARESSALVDAMISLSAVGIPSLTHHLLETLETFVSVDPVTSFARIASIVDNGNRGNYQLEPLAIPIIVRIVERYFADYRSLLQERDNQRRLLGLLDTFVTAGWSEAWQLTYRLEEIFR